MKTTPEDIIEARFALSRPADCTIDGLAGATVKKRALRRLLADVDAYAQLEAEMEKQAISCAVAAGKRCPHIHAADAYVRLLGMMERLRSVTTAAPIGAVISDLLDYQ